MAFAREECWQLIDLEAPGSRMRPGVICYEGSRMKFSERKGYKPVRDVIQREGMNDELRNSLWNILDQYILHSDEYIKYIVAYSDLPDNLSELSRAIWADFMKLQADQRPKNYPDLFRAMKNIFYEFQWFEVYDFIEFVLKHIGSPELNQTVNKVLERELAGYRFVGEVIADITDEQEIVMLEEALEDDEFPGVRAHLQRALELLSDRERPDYRNSIKESISAVESLAQIITGNENATLGNALFEIERKGEMEIHPALKQGFSKIYGYTSSEDGVRHAMLEEPDLSADDAKFFLVACTAFINYLKAKM